MTAEQKASFQEEVLETAKEEGVDLSAPEAPKRKKKLKQTFLNMGDPEPFEDEDFEFEADTHEELSSLAHGELEHHREMRHYARLAAWEMPLLSSRLEIVEGFESVADDDQNLRSHSRNRLPICH